jgi:ferredoxin/flavodoxin---NADP+ reductase
LKEVLALPNVRFDVTGADNCGLDNQKAEALLLDAAHRSRTRSAIVEYGQKMVDIRFHFCAAPQSFIRRSDGNELTVNREAGSQQTFKIDTVISATGFTNCCHGGEMLDDNWTGSNVFKVGWLNRNGKGTIAANRKDAKEVSDFVVAMLESGQIKEKARGFAYVEEIIRSKMIDYGGWKEIDGYERAHSPTHRCRRKLTDIAAMVSIAQRQASQVSEFALTS